MRYRSFWSIVLTMLFHYAGAQVAPDTSIATLEEVVIKAFEHHHLPGNMPSFVKMIDPNNSDRYNKTSLVHAFNTLAGVRMEERSPGSYRINIRGSSLRSPFGVRNVKVYWNDIPVTDAGGNTYFNQFAFNNFSIIEVAKGPAGSLYGAGTGGLILLRNFDAWKPGVALEYVRGSYGLHNLLAAADFGSPANKNRLTFSHNSAEGYRIHSAMRRSNVSWQSQLKASEKQTLTASFMYTHLWYQTPGGLTFNEYITQRRAARPAAGGFPSATDARAAIDQKNFITGITHHYTLHPRLTNITTVFGVVHQVKNAAIRNYERRQEPGMGGRTVFHWKPIKATAKNQTLQVVWGAEYQQGNYNIVVSKNRQGNPDTLLTNDDIRNTNAYTFAQLDWSSANGWLLSAGVSINQTQVRFQRLSNYPVVEQNRTYRNEWAPRWVISKQLLPSFYVGAILSRGFSPPTLAELLPSTGIISTTLEAEYGWNKELTFSYRKRNMNRQLYVDVNGFLFQLRDALVQRRDAGGADFFVNAGEVKQKGIETSIQYWQFRQGFITQWHIKLDHSFHHFRYGDFRQGNNDFSGKQVPSVPKHSLALLADMQWQRGFYSQLTYYYCAPIYLNDANTALADDWHLLSVRMGWKHKTKAGHTFNIYAGCDNLLNELYSLGNDINAAGGRFYNAAPERNIYIGAALQWHKPNRGNQ